MVHFEARAVRQLVVSDVIEFADDVRLFRVARIEPGSVRGRCRLHLRSMDGTRLSLLREADDRLRVAVSPRRPGVPG